MKQNRRMDCIVKLGGKCQWKEGCDWIDPRALHIDHVKGGGCQERKLLGSWQFYKTVLADKTGKYQLLCANHNMIKKAENWEYRGIQRVFY